MGEVTTYYRGMDLGVIGVGREVLRVGFESNTRDEGCRLFWW